jgi:FkbM family methyltransferase
MALQQFANSIGNIMRNRRVHRPSAILRHVGYQVRKAFNLFPFEQAISGSRIVASHRRCGVSALIYSQGLYDYHNMRLLQLALSNGGAFFDVGANIGSYSLVASEQSHADVYSFEPHPATYRLLEENIRLNDRRNVRLFPIALGAEEGIAFLGNNPGAADNAIRRNDSVGAIPVRLRRGEQVCAEESVSPSVMKIDVEGYEHDVLLGFGHSLATLDLLQVETIGLSGSRETEEAAFSQLLGKYKMIGPVWCDFDAKTFSSVRPRRYQDSVYLSERFRSDLERQGFRVMVSR